MTSGFSALGAGLSALGTGVANFAGTAALEQQKADLQNRSLALADQLATAREQNVTQPFQASQQAAQIASSEKVAGGQQATSLQVASIGAGAALAGENIRAASAERVANLQVNAEPPEVRAAKFLADPNTSPEAKTAYMQAEALKAGIPVWAVTAPATPASGGSAAPAGGAAPAAATEAPSVLPGDALTPPVTSAAKSVSGTASVTGTPAGGAPAASSKYNEGALADVPPQAVAMVKAMVDGRMAPPTSFAMAKPYWQTMMAKAMAYDPSFDETTWAGRVQTRKDFTGNGKDAQTVNALNTALGHAGDLATSFDKLNNFGGPATLLNAPVNALESAMGDPRQGVVQQNINALAAEARKVFSASGGGSLEELKEWQQGFPQNASPAQMHAYLGKFVGLLDSRLQSLADNYNRGMGRTSDPLELLSDHGRQAYEALTGNAPSNSTGYQLGNPSATTAPVSAGAAVRIAPTDPAAREVGKSYPLPNGKTGIWRGTGWEVTP